jgi:hypothetical protein
MKPLLTLLLLTLLLLTTVLPAQLVTNGDFAAGLTGWAVTGNVSPDNGVASFNGTATGADTLPSGLLSQTIPTTVGASYLLAFDVGAAGSALGDQKLQVGAEVFTLTKTGVGTQWSNKTQAFTATAATTTITFRDVSGVTAGIDLLLDNVVVSVAIPTITGSSVTLAWNANPESDIASYSIRYGKVSGSYPSIATTATTTTLTVSGLTPGVWYFVAVATSTSGLTSPPSSELAVTMLAPPAVPPSSPRGLRVVPDPISTTLKPATR